MVNYSLNGDLEKEDAGFLGRLQSFRYLFKRMPMDSNIGQLFKGNDFLSVVFRDFLIPSGQVSTRALLEAEKFKNDIDFHRDKIFVVLMQPLLQISDCFIQLINLAGPEVNLVYVLKEEVYELAKAKIENREIDGPLPQITERDILSKISKDITRQNIKIFHEFIKKQEGMINVDEVLEDLQERMKSQYPYRKYNINLDLYNILRIVSPGWEFKLKNDLEATLDVIKNLDERKKNRIEKMNEIIISKKKYWDGVRSELPTVNDFINELQMEYTSETEDQIKPEEVLALIKSSGDFLILWTDTSSNASQDIIQLVNGVRFRVTVTDSSIEMQENGRDVKFFPQKKCQVLERMLRSLLFKPIKLVLNPGKDTDANFLFYMKKKDELVKEMIKTKNNRTLRILAELLRSEPLSAFGSAYLASVQQVVAALEEIRLKELINGYIQQQQAQTNFFIRLINTIFSPWSEKNIEERITEQKTQVKSTVRNLAEEDAAERPTGSDSGNYNPVQSALQVISRDVDSIEIQGILRKDLPLSEKVNQICGLYDSIGARNKAIITKNQRLQEEFIKGVRDLLS